MPLLTLPLQKPLKVLLKINFCKYLFSNLTHHTGLEKRLQARPGTSLFSGVREFFGVEEISTHIDKLKVQAIEAPNDMRVQLALGTKPFQISFALIILIYYLLLLLLLLLLFYK